MFKKIFKISAAFAIVFFITITVTEQFAYARAGGGRSFGGRGSRSYSRPYTPSRQSTTPDRGSQPYNTQPGGGLLRGLGTGIAGGFIGSLLFRGMGFGGSDWGGGGGGVGPLEILIIAGIGFMIYRMMKRRKEGSGSSSRGGLFGGNLFGGNSRNSNDQESDLSSIKMSDHSFDENRFKDTVMDIFFKIQAAWMNRDLSPVKSLLTSEVKSIIQNDIDALIRSKKINRLENIAVRNVEISEAWQESGQDYITTLIYANILDYTISEEDGTVVSGSKTDPAKFEEFWTFTRPSASNQWMLSAINQV
jgi:predicted lipid-binding transport protein (Tim44 family)